MSGLEIVEVAVCLPVGFMIGAVLNLRFDLVRRLRTRRTSRRLWRESRKSGRT